MAYAIDNPIKKIAGGVGGALGIWSYVDGDTLATIDGAGYFNLEADQLQIGDVLICQGNSVGGILVVNANNGTTVDTSNTLTQIDSD